MADPVSAVGAGILTGALSGVIKILAFILVAGAIIGVAWWVRYLRQFDIRCEILSTRANVGGVNQYKTIYDKAGYIYDKTDKMYYFRIKDLKVDLPAPPFNVLIPTTSGNMIKIWQKSIDEYVFLLPDKIDNVIVTQDGKEYSVNQIKSKQVEGDVAFWNTKRKEKNKSLFNPESTLMRLLPFIVPLLMFILVIFITWMILKKFDVLADVANSLNEAAQALKVGTTASVTTHSP